MYYVICSTARSGSTLLSKALAEMGAGKPEEFLNRRETHITTNQSFMRPSPLAYMDHVKQNYTVNGIFALKAHYSQIVVYDDIYKNFTTLFPEAKYISITRRNALRRAVSASRARQTDAWTSAVKEKATPKFSYIGIIKQLINNAQEIELWVERFCRFFRGNGMFSRLLRYCVSRK